MTSEILFKLTDAERASAKRAIWQELAHRVEHCTACSLCRERTHTVLGEGHPSSPLMIIGEGPGADEDQQGRPFVGKAGQLLDGILRSVEIERSEVYITNVVKCRPPENRAPLPEEMAHCDRYLQTQILLVRPAMLVLLGNTPTKWLLRTVEGITKLRGRWFRWRGMPVMPMFHPSYLLRYGDVKKQGSPKHLTWLDITEVKKQLDEYKKTGSLEGITYG